MSSNNHRGVLFTSESVTEGHPDKIADQISDAVLDAVLAQDPMGRVACETLLTTGMVILDRTARKGSIDVAIDAAAVTSGSPSREDLLRGEEYFNVAQFPRITFKSTSLKFDGDRVVGADGELTIRGVTKPVALTVADFKCAIHPATKKPACGCEVTASVKRSDFGMTKNQASTGDDVNIAIAIEAIQQ